MPLNVKLHKHQIEVAHYIGESRGKLVPMADIRAKFKDSYRLSEALWVLLEQKVVVEAQDYPAHYQLTRDGAALIDELWQKLEEEKADAMKADEVVAKVRRERKKPIADAAEDAE